MTEVSQAAARNAIKDTLSDLYSILSLKRAKDSLGELKLITEFIIPTGANRDEFGNWYLRIGTEPVLWSCHTDTVHLPDVGKEEPRQQLTIDEYGYVAAKESSCLGADNGVGVWIMLRMIAARKEGLYIFHRQEETGGKGSKYISQVTPTLVEGIKIAIAFDRRGESSIITHQGTRTCSDAFAQSFIDQFDLPYKMDDGGTFTDTANYAKLIPECTNLSAGFHNEHTYAEFLDTEHAEALLEAILRLDVMALCVDRNVDDPDEYPDWGAYGQGWHRSYRHSDFEDGDNSYISSRGKSYSQRLIEMEPAIVHKVLTEWGLLPEMVQEIEKHSGF